VLGQPADHKKAVLLEAFAALNIKRSSKKILNPKTQQIRRRIKALQLEKRKKLFDGSSINQT
jgi:hypothetical protein